MIVEDEIRIREGLSKLLKRINPHYEIVGEAENGQEGFALITKEKPDLAFVDIQMPEMDGLQMLMKLQECNQLVKTIILSAYSEFDYAQQAIRLGVSDYLLKPINLSNLKKSLQKAETELAIHRHSQLSHPEELGSLEHIFCDLVTSNFVLTDSIKAFLKTKYHISPEKEFSIALIYLGSHFQTAREKLEKRLRFYCEKNAQFQFNILCFPAIQSSVVLFYAYPCKETVKSWYQKLILEQFCAHQKEFAFGWSTFCGLENIRKALTGIRQYLDFGIYHQRQMVCFPEITKLQTEPLTYPSEIENEIKKALYAQNSIQVEQNYLKFTRYFDGPHFYSSKDIKQAFIRLLWRIIDIMQEFNFEEYKNINLQELSEQVFSANTFQELVSPIQQLVQKKMFLKDNSGVSLTIQKAKSIAHELFDQGVTMEEVAVKLNITPQYLSMQFKKETGVNFNTYMKEYRTQKAKELLITTDLKLYEIAQRIGYNDTKYFSNVFKEQTGILPTEYRRKHK